MNIKIFIRWDKENTLFLGLIVLTFVLVYFSPNVLLTRIAFLGFLPLIYKSNNDYFWIAWLFLIVDAPGYLFQGGSFNDPARIPLYPILPSVSIAFQETVLFVFLLKILLKKTKYRGAFFLFHKESWFFFILMALYLLYSFVGFNVDVIELYRNLMPWVFCFIIYFTMNKSEENFIHFNKLLYPFIFVFLLTNFYSIINGVQFVNLFKETALVKSHLSGNLSSSDIYRNVSGVFFTIYVVTTALFYRIKNTSKFSNSYLDLIIIIGVINAFLTGTRGFLIAILLIVLSTLFLIKRVKKFKLITAFSILIILSVLILQIFSPKVDKQIKAAAERQATVFLLLKGDETAGGTLRRLTVRGPKVMKEVEKNPFLGYGFSSKFFNNSNPDVGFHTLLLNVGYFGTFILYLLVLSIIYKIFIVNKSSYYFILYKDAGKVFIFAILSILLFHNTTNMSFGFVPSVGLLYERYMIYGLLLVHFNTSYLISRKRIKSKFE